MDNALTVTEVNLHIKQLLDGQPLLNGLTVRGEASNYRVYPSGHHYFTLKDAEGVLKCVMFRGEASKLAFRPQDGMKLLARGRVSVFPRDGQYQLYCSALEPDGVGALAAAFEKLKAKLQAEGLFDGARKQPLPAFPRVIGLVTSPAGAAVRDILRVLNARWPMAEVRVFPVRVQGEEAPSEITEAIEYANAHNLADLLIIGRGGGSLEDLWAFNDERVARAIYASKIPTVSAVGHEPDVTISDYVADVRAATPSNAAELAAPDAAEWKIRLNSVRSRMAGQLERSLKHSRALLAARAQSRVLRGPTAYIEDRRMSVTHLDGRLSRAASAVLAEKRGVFARSAGRLDALSPLKVLSRGYSIAVTGDGKTLRRASDARIGQLFKLRMTDGILNCQVRENEAGDI